MAEQTLAPGRDGVLTRNGSTYDIVFERRLKQPIEQVWAAITEPERIADWFATTSLAPDLRVGAKLTISFGPDDTMVAEVVALEPPRLFAYRDFGSADLDRPL